jgi:hypothetical protein
MTNSRYAVSFFRTNVPVLYRVKNFLTYAVIHYRPRNPLVIEVDEKLCLFTAPALED